MDTIQALKEVVGSGMKCDIADVVYKYIDRMSDPCDEDPLEKSAAEFVDEVLPVIEAHLRFIKD